MRRPLAFLCHPYHRGGVTRWMVDAASSWVERGCNCWFVTPRPVQAFLNGAGRPALVQLVESISHRSRPALVAPLVGSEFEFGTAGHRARVYARALQTGVPPGVPVIVSDDPSTWHAVELLRGRNPLIGVLHADDAAYYALATRFHETASAIVSVSRRVHSRARSTVHAGRARAEIIPCGIPLPPLQAVRDGESAVTRLVWVGRISEPQKRVSDLVKIARALDQGGESFSLDIIGDGEDSDALRARVRDAGLSGRVEFHGWLQSAEVLALLGRSDIMLLPSNFEGMPVAAMEALACGCVVVGSDTSGLEEYADHPAARDALWIYSCGDIFGATTAIRLAGHVAREGRRSAARFFATDQFAIEVCLDRYEAMLEHLSSAPALSVPVAPWHLADVASWIVAMIRRATAWFRLRISPLSPTPSSSAVP
jgi:glycosyltransferase involved in cell wall biosynthesis